jgi:hypothetical protein
MRPFWHSRRPSDSANHKPVVIHRLPPPDAPTPLRLGMISTLCTRCAIFCSPARAREAATELPIPQHQDHLSHVPHTTQRAPVTKSLSNDHLEGRPVGRREGRDASRSPEEQGREPGAAHCPATGIDEGAAIARGARSCTMTPQERPYSSAVLTCARQTTVADRLSGSGPIEDSPSSQTQVVHAGARPAHAAVRNDPCRDQVVIPRSRSV